MLSRSALTSTVTVTPRLGRGGAGVRYGNPVPGVPVMVDTTSAIVRSSDGEDRTATTVMLARPDGWAGWTPGDQVTLATGRVVTVLAVNVIGGDRRPSHFEIVAG